MKLITLTSSYKTQWKSLISEFEENKEKLIPLAMKGYANTFEEFLIEAYNNSKGIDLPHGFVPSDIYFLVDDDSKYLIGAINIRHYLNDYLLKYGGNIGYGIRPSKRKKGYASEMLKLALKKCIELNMKEVLITCNKENIASAKTIIKNGGILENEISDENDDTVTQRYWIKL